MYVLCQKSNAPQSVHGLVQLPILLTIAYVFASLFYAHAFNMLSNFILLQISKIVNMLIF